MVKTLFSLVLMLCALSAAKAQNFLWAERYGGDGEDVVRALDTDGNGNAYMTGYYTDTANFGEGTMTSLGLFDVFVTKTLPDGTLAWSKSMGGVNNDYGTAISCDAHGNVYITGVFDVSFDADPGSGQFMLTAAGDFDIFVIKLDANGNFVWAKAIGGEGYEETTGIGVDNAGNVYVTGYFYNLADFNRGGEAFEMTPSGMSDGFIVKYKPDGSFTWAQRFGGEDFDLPMSMKVMGNGDMYLTGQFRGMADFNPNPTEASFLTTEQKAVFYLYLNESGYLQGVVNVGEAVSDAIGRDLAVDADGNGYIIGTFGGPMVFNAGTENEITIDSGTFTEGFVVKASLETGAVWAKKFDCEGASFALGIAINSQNETFVSGYYDTNLGMDDIALTQINENADENFLAKLDGDGNFVHAYQFGGANFIDSQHIRIDTADNIYIAGAFETTIDLNPLATAEQDIEAYDLRDSYLIKMDNEILGINNPQLSGSTMLYPNPATTITYLQSPENLTGNDYAVYDTSGRKIRSGKVENNNAIGVSTLPAGLYIVKLNGKFAYKLVKN